MDSEARISALRMELYKKIESTIKAQETESKKAMENFEARLMEKISTDDLLDAKQSKFILALIGCQFLWLVLFAWEFYAN